MTDGRLDVALYYTYLGEQAGHTYGFLAAAAASNGQTGSLWPDFLGHFANNFLVNKAAEFGIALRIRGTHT